jgi:hypothetical protein
MRLFGFTYFFSNFITFYNFIVTYNFLNLNTQPKFSYNTLKYLATLYYTDDNNILALVYQILNKLNVNFTVNFDDFLIN